MSRGILWCALALFIPQPLAGWCSEKEYVASHVEDHTHQGALHTYYIELNTLPACLLGSCPNRLTDRDVKLVANGHDFPVSVSQTDLASNGSGTDVPTHLLVVIPPGSKYPSNGALGRALAKALAHGWLVSVTRIDGSYTPYSSGGPFESNRPSPTSTPLELDASRRAIHDAIVDLAQFAGERRLLIDGGDKAGSRGFQWESDAPSSIRPVYLVDGGVVKQVAKEEIESTYRNPGMWDFQNVRQRNLSDQLSHEVSLKKAVKDMLLDSRYDYQFQCAIPESEVSSDGTFSLEIDARTNPKLLPGTVTAEIYEVSVQEVNGRTVLSRLNLPQRVRIVVNLR